MAAFFQPFAKAFLKTPGLWATYFRFWVIIFPVALFLPICVVLAGFWGVFAFAGLTLFIYLPLCLKFFNSDAGAFFKPHPETIFNVTTLPERLGILAFCGIFLGAFGWGIVLYVLAQVYNRWMVVGGHDGSVAYAYLDHCLLAGLVFGLFMGLSQIRTYNKSSRL